MKKNNKGFTLIEIIAVIVIIGVIFIIAVPAVSSYILDSRKTTYSTTISSYMETIMGEYEMRSFGDYVDENEIMLVPIKLITLEKGDSNSSPFGEYVYNQSYVVISSNEYDYNYYANFLDDSGYGVSNVKMELINDKSIVKVNANTIPILNSYATCDTTTGKYELSDVIFTFNSKEYIPCDYRLYNNGKVTFDKCKNSGDSPVIVMCER